MSVTTVILMSLPATEKDLARRLGVSFGTARTYLYQLRRKGFVIKKSRDMWDRA